MCITHRCSTCKTISLSQWIARPAELAGDASQPFRKSVRGAQGNNCAVYRLPDLVSQLDAFNILREVIQAVDQAEGVAKSCNRSVTQARSHSQPGLLAYFHHDPVFNSLDADGHGCLSTRGRAHSGGDLYSHFLFCPHKLRMKVPTVELSHECMSKIVGFDVSVKNSSVHVFDYNPLYKRRRSVVAFHIIMNIYAMKRIWFKALMGLLAVTGLGWGTLLIPNQVEAFQDVSTPTGVFVTVTYTDPINVRGGPSTVYYPIVGQLNPGDVVPALGVSPGREWVQVSFPSAASGTGWVYASFISLSGGELRIVEPPPTPTPLATATIDPTLAAAFNVQPTSTRLATFTPPAPLEVIEMDPPVSTPRMAAPGIFIMVLGLIGGIGLLVSIFLRK